MRDPIWIILDMIVSCCSTKWGRGIRMIGLPGFKYHALLAGGYTFNPQMTQILVRVGSEMILNEWKTVA